MNAQFCGQALWRTVDQSTATAARRLPVLLCGDLVDGIYRLLMSSEVEPVNIGNPTETSILGIAQKINEYTNNAAGIQFKPLPKDDPKQRQPNITKAQRVLGWQQSCPGSGCGNDLWFAESVSNLTACGRLRQVTAQQFVALHLPHRPWAASELQPKDKHTLARRPQFACYTTLYQRVPNKCSL
ncbi:MAG: hypothetical protein R3E79_01070 [Caldilineaceae bacterium]